GAVVDGIDFDLPVTRHEAVTDDLETGIRIGNEDEREVVGAGVVHARDNGVVQDKLHGSRSHRQSPSSGTWQEAGDIATIGGGHGSRRTRPEDSTLAVEEIGNKRGRIRVRAGTAEPT